MRSALALLLVSAAALAAASQPFAKEGVVARLENPAALRAPAGTKISLVWTLREAGRPFQAAGVYVRLGGRAGGMTGADAVEIAPGRYRARVAIPRGGVRSILVALRGWATDARGTRRADAVFRIVNDPTRG